MHNFKCTKNKTKFKTNKQTKTHRVHSLGRLEKNQASSWSTAQLANSDELRPTHSPQECTDSKDTIQNKTRKQGQRTDQDWEGKRDTQEPSLSERRGGAWGKKKEEEVDRSQSLSFWDLGPQQGAHP